MVVLTIIDEEFDAARARLGGPAVTELGTTGNYSPDRSSLDVVLSMCVDRSIGPALEMASELLAAFRPELLVVCGVAGGIAGRSSAQGSVEVGDVVVAETLHDVSFRKITEGRDSLRHYAFDQPSNGLLVHGRALARDLDLGAEVAADAEPPGDERPQPKIHLGPVVVYSAVVGDPKHPEQRQAVGRLDNALALEMESVGVGRAVHSARSDVNYNPRLLVVRGISDMIEGPFEAESAEQAAAVEDRNNRQRHAWKPYAAAAAACVAGKIVERFLLDPDPRVRTADQALDFATTP